MNARLWVCLLLVSSFCWIVSARSGTNRVDTAALRSLRKQWKNTPPNWVKRNPCGRKWEGVSCSGSRVTSIILPGTNLSGPLPEAILSLSKLQNLDLSNNRGLTGFLPSNIGSSLKNLESLVLVNCNFSGPIPESLGLLQNLTKLFLNLNHFAGPIPDSIGNLAKLVWLDLSNNQLDGEIPVSNKTNPGLDMLLKAKHFHLGQNKLSGEIPLALFSSKMDLKHLILNDNQLSGSIPDTLILASNLEVIRLDRNSLSGNVPQKLNTLTSVTELYLANNKLSNQTPNLTGMNLLTYVDMSNNSFERGGIPAWCMTLPNVTTLIMENTGMDGSIPAAIFSLPQIQTVVLKNNRLNGTLDLGTNFSGELQLIDMQNNNIDQLNLGKYNHSILIDGNMICTKPEALGICKTVQKPSTSNFGLQQSCAPPSCFTDLVLLSECKRPYLGSLIFRSFSFSDYGNLFNYDFLWKSLQPFLASNHVPVDKVCLVFYEVDMNGYLVLNIAFFPPGGAFYNRTAISVIGNILNGQKFDSPYGPYYFKDVTYPSFPGRSKNTGLIIGITLCGFVLVVLTVAAGLYAYRQRKIANKAAKSNHPFSSWNHGDLPQLKGAKWFSFEDVRLCTDNFSYSNEVGAGGYGKVYKGKLDTGQLVAIKRAQQGSLQGALEFKTEIELLSRIHHRNVVNLVGFCYDKGEQMLIYEYFPNGSLRAALTGKSGVRLRWVLRVKVALDAARGLAYLHELADPPIIHRDIKPDNILLDNQLIAKVADFGLSTLLQTDKDYVTASIKGTFGYLDPEFYMTQVLTEKSDVYSFGVVMLELVTGRPPIEKNKYLVKEVREILNGGMMHNLVDPAIISDSVSGLKEFVDLAMSCLQDVGEKRPSMSEVVKRLENIIHASDLHVGGSFTTTSSNYDGVEDGSYPYSSSDFFDSRVSIPYSR